MAFTEIDRQTLQQTLLAAPNIKQAVVTLYTLGGPSKASLGITIGLDAKETWVNNIFDNSRHFKLMLEPDGSLVWLMGSKIGLKLRKSKVKSVDEAAAKVIKFVNQVCETVA